MVLKPAETTTQQSFELRIEHVRTLLPPGFIPKYPPTAFNQHLSTLVNLKQEGFFGEKDKNDNDGQRVKIQVGVRHDYDSDDKLPKDALEAQQGFSNILVFNQQMDADGEVKPISLGVEKFADVRDLATDFMNKSGDVIIAGFAGEASSVRGCLESAIDFVGSDHVIAVDAGIDPRATLEAHKADCKVIPQQAVLETCYDWERMQALYGLPYSRNRLPSGKGTSHWVGAAYAEVIGLLTPSAHLIQKDTDVLNPRQWIPEIYLALPRIYAPEGEPILFTQILRTGEGRNNEPWLYQANALANARTRSKEELGIVLGSLTWPLSDSRSGEWSVVSRLPTTNSMGMETIRNVAVAGLSIEMKHRLIAQIVNPDKKIENEASPADREFKIIFHCAQLLRDLATHVKETGLWLHQWSRDEIKTFNEMYGGERTLTFVPPSVQRANLLSFTRQEYIFPSIHQMIEDGVIDRDRLKKM